jgi:hypothetical protein
MGYFNHPFDTENRMRLLDDVMLDKPLSEDSLASDFSGVDINKNGRRNAKEREIVDEEDIFNTLQRI